MKTIIKTRKNFPLVEYAVIIPLVKGDRVYIERNGINEDWEVIGKVLDAINNELIILVQ